MWNNPNPRKFMRRLLLFSLSLLAGIMWGQTYTYRCWTDNDINGTVSGSATGETQFSVDYSALSNGIHAIHIQARNDDGVYSSVHTRFFLKDQQQVATTARYWLDNDLTTMHNNVAASGVIELDITELKAGLHAVHYQRLAADGTPSTVRTRYFYIDRVEDSYTASISIDGGEAIDYPVSGEDIMIDIGELETGEHILLVKIYDSKNSLMDEQTQTFTVEPIGPVPLMFVSVAVPVPATSNTTLTLGGSNCIDQSTSSEPLTIRNDNLLECNEFIKDLRDFFYDGSLNADALEFEFTMPSTMNGNATFNADAKGQWSVNGYSGAVYTLALANDNKEIRIVRKNGSVLTFPQTLACINNNVNGNQSVIKYHQGIDQDDILNYKGHNHLGEGETFTAYVGVSTSGVDSPGMFDDMWLNVRFLRPLDLEVSHGFRREDTKDEWQYINLSKVTTVKDWRDYLGDPYNGTSGSGENQKFDFSYYQIDLDADGANILTDAGFDDDVRQPVTGDVGDNLADAFDLNFSSDANYSSRNLWNISEISGLIVEKVQDYDGTPCPSGSRSSLIRYKNSASLTGSFRIFVPIRMNYIFGQSQQSAQVQYVTIEIKEQNQEPGPVEPVTEKTVDVAVAGTLSNYISDAEMYTITQLTVTGYLNSTDFKLLRDMAGNNYLGNETEGKLQKLDLSGATIVTGGEYYLEAEFVYYKPGYGISTSGDHLAIENDNELGKDVFKGCKLKEVILPDNLTSVAYGAFDYCKYLTDVVMPEGLTRIGDSAFLGCDILQPPSIPTSVETIGRYAFAYCYEFTSFEIPDGITTLNDNVFYECMNLKSVVIPASVTEIQNQVFELCNSLEKVEIYAKEPPYTNYNSFTTQANATLYVPYGCKSAYAAISPWNGFKQILEMEPYGSETNIIEFADANVKAICVENWDTDEDGELSEEEAAAVTDLGSVFWYNSTITSFNELKYFTGLTSIESFAFGVCSELTSIVIPNGVISIGSQAFQQCTSLVSIDMPSSVSIIEDFAFSDCIGLTSVSIPNNVIFIGANAFIRCSDVVSLTIPKSVTSIGEGAFWGCSSLISVTVDKSDPIAIEGNVFSNYENAILYVPKGCIAVYAAADYWKEFKNIREIGSEISPAIIFADMNVKAICVENWDTNGDGELSEEEAAAVSDLGNYFYKSEIIESFDELKYFTGLKIIPSYAFQGCINLSSVVIPVSVKTIDMFAFEGCKKLKNANLPQGLSKLEYFAFGSCESLESVIIPEGVAEIGSHAFRGCSALKSLELQEGLVKIEQAAFQNCTMLLSIEIPSTVESINTSAFSGCEKLETVTMTSGVKSIGTFCFQDCTSLTEVTFSKDLESIWNFAFDGCTQLKEVDLPEGLTTLGSNAFSDCESLVSVNIPGSLTEIGSSAFLGCSAMTSLTLHEGLMDIGRNAFQNCVMLPSVVIPSTVEGIAVSAFANCERLAMVVMSKNVKIIGSFAFQDCKSLGAITLPETLQTIENFSFDGCSQLTSVTARMEEPVDIDYYTFTNRTNATLYVPIGSKALYQVADYWKEFKNIIEMDEEGTLRGDVNGDKLVNGTDLVALTCMILGQQEENAAADVYVDGLVNGTDYVALVDIILNFSASSARSMAARSTSNNLLMAKVGIEPFSIAAGESQTMTITLDNPNMDVTLIQFDMTLPEGLRLKTDEDGYAVEMTGRTTWKDHTVYIGSLSEGSVRMILASGKNALIDGNSGGILNLTMVADENYDGGDIMLHHILCTSPDTQECWPYDYTLHLASSSTTRIDGIKEGQTSDIYNVSGQRLSAPRKGINIINGRKVVVK